MISVDQPRTTANAGTPRRTARRRKGPVWKKGTSAENGSLKIEIELQLEGLEGNVPQDKNDEAGGDDDAVEMSTDSDGQMEDRGDGEKDESEGGESDDGDDEQETKQRYGATHMMAKHDQEQAPYRNDEQGQDASKDEADKQEPKDAKTRDDTQGDEQDGERQGQDDGSDNLGQDEQEAERVQAEIGAGGPSHVGRL